ncbi:type II toxin-antitoxin system VapC family toxin [Labrys sp. KB_33_2]|uniref:type II toxin-antitoxin system VapC family toxin n=1 Tax=Labrys sp. KB_33_2 TaxID=3237479 RepID=UPI003F8D919E
MYLLDTNIFSEAGCGSAPAISWLRPVNSTSGHLSTMTRGEIMRGIALRQKSDPRRANHLVEGLRKPRPARAGRIPRVTGPICIGRGRIAPTRSRGDINGLIAAAAMVHDLILVIRNVADFDGTGASVINPWKVKT